MNLNDRLALLLGRAVMRAETLSVALDEAQAQLAKQTEEIAAIRAELDTLKSKTNAPAKPPARRKTKLPNA